MANIVNISLTNTFEQWRVKNNEIGTAIGDLSSINSNAEAGEDTVVSTLNNLRTETTNNAGWIGDVSLLFSSYGNTVDALNNSHSRLNTKDTEQGAIADLTHYTTYPSLVTTLNSHDSRLDTAEAEIGDVDLYNNTFTNLTQGINEVHNDLVAVANNVGVSITQSFATLYNGTQTSFISGMNNDYARLNKLGSLIGGTQTNGNTVDFVAADLYGTHTNLVDAINGIEDFQLTNSKWDGTDNKSLIWALNNHESRLDTEESNVDALQADVGTWSTYEGLMAGNSWAEGNITDAIIDIRNRQDDLTSDFLNASGDTMTGNLNFTSGGVQATGQYLNLGVGGTNTIRINTSNRVGVGKAAHSSYKFDVSGTLNATDLKIGGESLDDRFLEVTTVSGWDEVSAQVKLKNNVTFSDEVRLGSKVIYNTGLSFDEVVQDVTGGMFTSNSENGGIYATYSDTTRKITLGISDDGHNHVWGNIDNATETVQDIVGAMVASNSESGISVVYQFGDGTLDFNVNDPTITLSGDVTGSATMSNLGDINITTTVGDNNHTHDDRYYTETESNSKFLLNTSDTLTGTLNITAGLNIEGDTVGKGNLYIGKNGGGDSNSFYYDDNSNTWRTFKWDDSSNEWQMEDTGGTMRKAMHSGNTLKVLNSAGTQLFP